MRYLTKEEKLAPLQDRHKGEPIYIIGLGPSLTLNTAHLLEKSNAITFGTNKSFKMLRTTYHIHVDCHEPKFSTKSEKYLEAMVYEGSYLFAPLDHHYEKTTGWANHYFYSDFQVAFTSDYFDESRVLNLGHSSTGIFHAIQIAVIMGCNPIKLVGVDFTTVKTREGFVKMHAYEYQNKMLPKQIESLEERRVKFEVDIKNKALPELKKRGVRIVNLSPISKLTVFEKEV